MFFGGEFLGENDNTGNIWRRLASVAHEARSRAPKKTRRSAGRQLPLLVTDSVFLIRGYFLREHGPPTQPPGQDMTSRKFAGSFPAA